MSKTHAKRMYDFLVSMRLTGVPDQFGILNPYLNEETRRVTKTFLEKYYSDENVRVSLFGINPGRFGGGLTGIPFTDPVQLLETCEVENIVNKRAELSSTFIYKVIKQAGGPKTFFSTCVLTAVCPIGFVANGKNANYYDSPELYTTVKEFISNSLDKQRTIFKSNSAIVLGSGKNAHFFEMLNREFNWFTHVFKLEHPRFIMQYKRKELDAYVYKYREILSQARYTLHT